jgi:hypothetical protein
MRFHQENQLAPSVDGPTIVDGPVILSMDVSHRDVPHGGEQLQVDIHGDYQLRPRDLLSDVQLQRLDRHTVAWHILGYPLTKTLRQFLGSPPFELRNQVR